MTYSTTAAQTKGSSTLGLAARARALKASGRDIISFTVGEPDHDTPDYVKAAAIAAINGGKTKYTAAAGTPALRAAICGKLLRDNGLRYGEGDIVVSNGAKHALANVFKAILNPGDEVLLPAPYWLSYPEMIRLAGGVPVPVQTGAERGYVPTARELGAAATSRTKALLINSPNNPSGMVYAEAALRELAAFAKERGLFVVSDEIYEKLIYDGLPHVSIAALNDDAFSRAIVINGFSKAYAMTGWRVGYSACRSDLAAIIANVQSHLAGSVNTIAQEAATAALSGGEDYLRDMRESFERRRNLLFDALKATRGLSPLPPQGAFYVFADASALCKAANLNNAAELAERLLEAHGVAVVPCADFGAPSHIRLTYAVSEGDITEGAARIAKFALSL